MRKRPNIIVVVIDTARAQNFSCYGHARETTPQIDAIAKEGVRFTDVTSASPWTFPSHASLFTGLYPSQHGAHAKHKSLDEQHLTMAEFFKANGYQTVAINMNSWISDTFGLARGFDHFFKMWQWVQSENDVTGVNLIYQDDYKGSLPRQLLRRLLSGNLVKNTMNTFYTKYLARYHDYGGRRITAEAKRWIQKNVVRRVGESASLPDLSRGTREQAGAEGGQETEEAPFFMFLNYLEPHLEYKPPQAWQYLYSPDKAATKRFLEMNQIRFAWEYNVSQNEALSPADKATLEALYDAELSYTDSLVGQLYTFLAQNDILDDTILVITSDHGENIGDHDFLDHQYCLYETLLKVPLLIRYPQQLAAGQEISKAVQSIDLFPTLVELARLDAHDLPPHLPGINLLSEQEHEFILAEYMGPQPSMEALKRMAPDANPADMKRFDRALRAIKVDQWKYIWASDGMHELYDLASDPTESNNLIEQNPEIAQQLQLRLDEWVGTHEMSVTSAEPEIDSDLKLRLEALGYM